MPLYRNVKTSDTLRIGDSLVTFERVKGQTIRVRIEGPATVTQITQPSAPPPTSSPQVSASPATPKPTLFRSGPPMEDEPTPGARVPT